MGAGSATTADRCGEWLGGYRFYKTKCAKSFMLISNGNRLVLFTYLPKNTETKMRKHLTLMVALLFAISSCTTNTEWHRGVTGAYVGSVFGSIIGDIVGGYHGSNVGALVGGVAGAAAGVASAKAQQERHGNTGGNRGDDYGYDYGNGYSDYGYDNSINYGNGGDYDYAPPTNPADYLEIRNIVFTDDNDNRYLEPEETAYISLDIYNRSGRPIYNVAPIVTCDNERIRISSTATISCIRSGQGIRYRCVVNAKRKLRSGVTTFRIGFAQKGYTTDPSKSFKIRTSGTYLGRR